jgi:PAS domain S-box-containing protein
MMVCKFPVFDQNGSVVMVAGAGVDITDRKRAEAALWDSLNLVGAITEGTTDAIYAKDREGRYLMINTAGARFLGKSPHEVIGLDDTQLFSADTAARIIKRDHIILESGETRTDEDISTGPSGVRIYLTTKGPLRDSSGAITGLFGVSRDITERKRADDLLRRSEEKFKTLFGIAPVGISVLDHQLNLVDSNPALEQITRLSKEELLNGAWLRRTYLDPDGTPKAAGQLPTERAMAANRRINDSEIGIVTENGEIIWVQVSVAPLTLPDASMVVITQDITERKRAAEKLEEANRQLRILSQQLFHIQEEERRHLARELHDEIGQTLTAAKINLKIIAPDVPAKVSSRLDDSIQLLDRLLRQVRQLSLDLRPPLLDELGLVPTLRWLVDQQAQRAGLRVTFTAKMNGAELEPDVQTACFRVAQEAITNIIRHSGAKNVSVELRLEAERLTLRVRDDGAGFNPAAMQESVTLGLVSMKERASLAGGGLEVHSTPARGTEIQAWFPLARGEHPSSTEIQ